MKISALIKPNSREDGVSEGAAGDFLIKVKSPPKGGGANEAVIKAVADYFGVSRSRVSIIKGSRSRQKTIEII